MTTLKYKNELISKLKDKEYRRAFMRSHIKNGIAFQIRTMRTQKPWTQEELAEQIGKQQTAISRLENPDYGRFTLKTLEELADIFDVALVVRFAPFGDLADWDLKLSSEKLERIVEFKDDPYFKEEPQLTEETSLFGNSSGQCLLRPITDLFEWKKEKEKEEKEINDQQKALSQFCQTIPEGLYETAVS